MLKNYLKTAWRNIRKNKLFSFINILGLSIGIATAFIILLYVQSETNYDRYNKNADRMARIVFKAEINGGKINESVVMAPVAATLKKDFPEVEDATRIKNFGTPQVTVADKFFKEDKMAAVDPNFFAIFTLPLLEGKAAVVLAEPNTLVITKSTALKYFGTTEVVGKTLQVNNDSVPYKITGVMKDIPVHSHFHFDLLTSMKGYRDATSDSWLSGGFHTYLLLKEDTDIRKIEARFPEMVRRYMGPQIQQQMGLTLDQFIAKGNQFGFKLEPLTSIHLKGNTSNEFEPGGNATYVYIFAGVALFMLLVACINFVNLSTAGASKRAKEVGVRKVAGSGRLQLIQQFLSESVLIGFFAALMALLLLQLFIPFFNDIAGKQLAMSIKLIFLLVAFALVVGIAAGIYPAFYLSSFKPIAVLKGKFTRAQTRLGLRSSLVVFQFFISVVLIIGTIVVYRQMKFIHQKDLGFNKNQILILPNSWALGNNEKAYKQDMLQDPRVLNATLSWYKPAGPSNYNNALAYPESQPNLLVNGVDYHVDESYIPTMEMKIVSGRNFSNSFSTDSSGIILNETAVRALGWDNVSAIGKILVRQNSPKGENYRFHVLGVVKNFNFKSLHENISPLFMTLYPEGGLIFKVRGNEVSSLLAVMKKNWERYNTGEPFTYAFLDDLFNKTYATEQKTGSVLNVFALLTIFVACLGLFGLATYTAEQRVKEIGIRKVLGASTVQLTEMLSREFLKLVVIASLVAFPFAWWGMNHWLQSFAYRIDISWWIFAVAALLAMLIALLTVSFQAIKAALTNPVKALRAE